ncbi:MAG: hypothetical protein JWN04_5085 [Myxococcaceae bacterium]|nr:hypothetical protein [Myxococcaceae bacterium]
MTWIGAQRKIVEASSLATGFAAALYPSAYDPRHTFAIGINVDDGAGGAPSDSPVGTWQLQRSLDGGVTWFRVLDADADLSKAATTGNKVANGMVIFNGLQGENWRLAYVRASGGGGNSRCTIWQGTWDNL